MKSRVFVNLLWVSAMAGLLFSCRPKPADPSMVQSADFRKAIEEVYPKLRLFYQTNFLPGMSVAVSVDNKLVFADGFGYSNLEFKVKASPAHKYRIGQVSELITALTAARLSEDGKLSLDKPIYELDPSLNQANHNFTIRQLGAHAAGLRAERDKAGEGNQNDLESVIASFINDSLIYRPGTAFYHTQLGYDLIGYLIAKTQNQPFPKVVKRILTDTLKLTSTLPDLPFRITDEKATPYDFDYLSQPIVAPTIDLRGKEASAGYLSSVTDLVKLGNLLLYPGFLKQETIDLMTRPYALSDGKKSRFGFGVISMKDKDGKTFYGQVGSVEGGSAALLIYPDDKIVIAIATNIQGQLLELPVFDVALPFMQQLHPEMIPGK